MYKQIDINNISLPICISPLRFKKEKIIDVYGDSFSALHKLVSRVPDMGIDRTKFSWQWFLSQLLGVTIRSYGISSSSEQLIYYNYKNTINNTRNAVIIFHTSISRTKDKFLNLERLKRQDYIEWDNQIIDPTIHLYWTDFQYKFRNGISKISNLHNMYACNSLETQHPTYIKNIDFSSYNYDKNLKDMQAHHMNINGNFLLAAELVEIFKDKFNFKLNLTV